MGKNRLDQINTQKTAHAEEEARAEAEVQLRGENAWEGQDKDARISMRIESELKETYKETLPRHTRISDDLRDYMIRKVRERNGRT